MVGASEFVVCETFKGDDPFLLDERFFKFKDRASALRFAIIQWRSKEPYQIYVFYNDNNNPEGIRIFIW